MHESDFMKINKQSFLFSKDINDFVSQIYSFIERQYEKKPSLCHVFVGMINRKLSVRQSLDRPTHVQLGTLSVF